MAAVDDVGHVLRRRNVGRVLLQVAELCQRKMRRSVNVAHCPMHAVVPIAVKAAVAAAMIILRRASQILFFFIIVSV